MRPLRGTLYVHSFLAKKALRVGSYFQRSEKDPEMQLLDQEHEAPAEQGLQRPPPKCVLRSLFIRSMVYSFRDSFLKQAFNIKKKKNMI